MSPAKSYPGCDLAAKIVAKLCPGYYLAIEVATKLYPKHDFPTKVTCQIIPWFGVWFGKKIQSQMILWVQYGLTVTQASYTTLKKWHFNCYSDSLEIIPKILVTSQWRRLKWVILSGLSNKYSVGIRDQIKTNSHRVYYIMKIKLPNKHDTVYKCNRTKSTTNLIGPFAQKLSVYLPLCTFWD